MQQHRYILKKGSKKMICPECDNKTFVPFIDTTTGDQLPDKYGRCDREVNCAYFLSPYKDGFNKPITFNYTNPRPVKQAAKRLSIVKVELLKQSRTAYEQNYFVQWLKLIFGPALTSDLISRYQIGTSNHWPGATIFWQIDNRGRVRSGKIMLYNQETGRRVKNEKYSYINWVHSVLKVKDFELRQCLFGEHLLNQYPASPIAVVESEKTAIIASVYLPRFIWLAVGSLTNLNAEKSRVLVGRKVYLFPDLNGFDKWKEKADQLSKLMPGTSFKVSDYLELNAPEADKHKGLDLADYLIRFKPEAQININVKHEEVRESLSQNSFEANCEKGENSEPFKTTSKQTGPTTPIKHFKPFRKEFVPTWDISDFKALQLTDRIIQIDKCSTILNVQNYIEGHIEVLNHNNGNMTFAPFFNRLVALKKLLKTV